MVDPALDDWLLDSDPALRWQVERDLLGLPPDAWEATRARVATEGFGARLLAHQDPDGQWAGGAFFPRGFDFTQVEQEGQPWTATTWSLNSLREWGVDPAVLAGTADRLARNSHWEYDDLPYWGGEVDCCINAWTLMNGLWLGADVEGIAAWFRTEVVRRVEHVVAPADGRAEPGHPVRHRLPGGQPMHEPPLQEVLLPGPARIPGPRRSARRRLVRQQALERIERRMERRTGRTLHPLAVPAAVGETMLHALFEGTPPDPRMAEAIEAIRAQRQPDGRWLQRGRDPGRVWFEVDVSRGEPSKWLTLMGTRVLAWWDTAAPEESPD